MSGRNFTSKWVSSQYYLFICILYLLYTNTNTHTQLDIQPQSALLYFCWILYAGKKRHARENVSAFDFCFVAATKQNILIHVFISLFIYLCMYIGIYRGVFFFILNSAHAAAHTRSTYFYILERKHYVEKYVRIFSEWWLAGWLFYRNHSRRVFIYGNFVWCFYWICCEYFMDLNGTNFFPSSEYCKVVCVREKNR